jgi:hypothetical protein
MIIATSRLNGERMIRRNWRFGDQIMRSLIIGV